MKTILAWMLRRVAAPAVAGYLLVTVVMKAFVGLGHVVFLAVLRGDHQVLEHWCGVIGEMVDHEAVWVFAKILIVLALAAFGIVSGAVLVWLNDFLKKWVG